MSKEASKNLSYKRRILFRVFSLILSLSLLIVVELGLRLFSYGGSMKLFVDHRVENFEDYYLVNPFVGLKYFSRFKATEATNDIFLKDKPENSYRIFVVGSSTIYGFPYERNLMASRILHKRLKDAYPQKNIEVVNTSITAINTVTLKDFARQLVKYEPDALLIYAGHNEFYGAYGIGSNETLTGSGFLRAAHFNLMNLRLYQLMQKGISGIKGKGKAASGEADQKGTLMKRIVKDKEITYEGEKYTYGVLQFRDNMSDILDMANKHGITVFLSDLVSNVRDIPPFGDLGSGDQSAVFNYKAAKDALSTGDSALAKTLFYKAKDLDPVRFRASEEINQIIYELAKEKKARLIQVKKRFEEASPGGLIGNELLSEHVHPNIEGQFLLADVWYDGIIQSELLPDPPNPFTEKSASYYRRNWAYTELDSLIGEFKVLQLKSYWPYTSIESEVRFRDLYKPEGMVEQTAFSVITDPDARGESLHHQLGTYYEQNAEFGKAVREFDALVHINPYWPDYLNVAANAFFNLRDLNKAESYLRESMKYDTRYSTFSMLGEIEFIKHDYQSALNFYVKALSLPEYKSVGRESKVFLLTRLYYLYNLNNSLENKQRVGSELRKLGFTQTIPLEDHPFDYSNYIPYDIEQEFNKAVHFAGTNIDSAHYYLERCLKINDSPVVNLYLGDILYQKQDLKALFHYEKAYAAYENDPNFLSRLFYAYFVNVNKAGSEKVLNQLKSLDPSNSEIPRFETLLKAIS
jgi:tetratricopeptide (TPR) repeat protein